jgi:hypothetical protein
MLTKFVKGGGSYLSNNHPRLLFGLRLNDKPTQLTIHWANGKKDVIPSPHSDKYLTIAEPQQHENNTLKK